MTEIQQFLAGRYIHFKETYAIKNKWQWWQIELFVLPNGQLVWLLWLDRHFYTRFWDKLLAISVWKICRTAAKSWTAWDSVQEWSTIWHISSKCKSKRPAWISWICSWKVQSLQMACDGSRRSKNIERLEHKQRFSPERHIPKWLVDTQVQELWAHSWRTLRICDWRKRLRYRYDTLQHIWLVAWANEQTPIWLDVEELHHYGLGRKRSKKESKSVYGLSSIVWPCIEELQLLWHLWRRLACKWCSSTS